MSRLVEIAKEKLDYLGEVVNPHYSIIPQLMQAVFNQEIKDDLKLNPEDREDLEMEIYDLTYQTDQEVVEYLFPEPEEMVSMVEEATTEEELRRVLIMELLWNAKMEREDWPARYYHS